MVRHSLPASFSFSFRGKLILLFLWQIKTHSNPQTHIFVVLPTNDPLLLVTLSHTYNANTHKHLLVHSYTQIHMRNTHLHNQKALPFAN